MILKKPDITRAMMEAGLSAPYAQAKEFARFVIALNKMRELQQAKELSYGLRGDKTV